MLRYREIKMRLMDIISGMRENDKLPSRPFLCSKLDTTRVTLDKAIRELSSEGYLASKKGSGTYVTTRVGNANIGEGYWGIIIPDILEPIYSGIVRGIENVAQEHNVSVTLCNSDNDASKQEQYLNRLIHSGAAGLIIVPVISLNVRENCRLYDQVTDAKIPFVFCNRMVEGVSAPIVTSNDYYGGYIGAKHLIEHGYRRFGYISRIKYSTSTNRCHGFLTAIVESGLEIKRQNIIMVEQPSGELPGYLSMKRMLENDPTIDSVFCFNDRLAPGIYQAIEERGLRVSDDIGVISYDNTIPLCEQLTPSLSSLSYQNTEIGKKAAEILWKIIDHQPISEFNYYIMQPEIVARDSCLGPKERRAIQSVNS